MDNMNILASNEELYHAGVKGMKWGVRKENYSSGSKQHGSSKNNHTVVTTSRNGKVTKAVNTHDNSSYKYKKTRRGAKVVARHNKTTVRVIVSNSAAVAAGALRVAAAFVPGAGVLYGASSAAALAGTLSNILLR